MEISSAQFGFGMILIALILLSLPYIKAFCQGVAEAYIKASVSLWMKTQRYIDKSRNRREELL